MRLKKIKLAGFKSFVDPTVLDIKDDLVAVVGPNGCGKSNVIDAVRWVMGESSAKNLRGESMADVIFNGSTTRKPVGQASIELIFDNSDGSLGGEYASYSEISVRRVGTREGESQYYLNGTRCRRKDVTEVFLGTGLGPRSYAIIEQGMISRVIEAKPEELRLFLEEAAGISLYKERRKETEKRMSHTRENLERLNDLRQEQDKQLERLKRQSESAAKYQEYVQLQTTADTCLSVLKWQTLNQKLEALSETIRSQSILIEEKSAKRTKLDLELETLRVTRSEKEDALQIVQSQYYEVGSEIARIEQQLQHHAEQQKQIKADLAQIEQAWQVIEQQRRQDETALTALESEEAQFGPQYQGLDIAVTQATEARQNSEEAMRSWNKDWEAFQHQSVEPQRQAEIEKTKIEQYERQIREGHARLVRLQQEFAQIDVQPMLVNIDLWQAQQVTEKRIDADQSNALSQIVSSIQSQKETNKVAAEALYRAQTALQNSKAELRSVQALQEAALGKDNETLQHWLKAQGLDHRTRLAEHIRVSEGFERAFEVVLNNRLQALCLETSDGDNVLTPIEAGELTLIRRGALGSGSTDNFDRHRVLLASKLETSLPIHSWLANIWVADSWKTALQQQDELAEHESLITSDGLWVSKHWTKLYGAQGEFSGVLQRESRLKALAGVIETAEIEVEGLQTTLESGQQALQTLEGEREALYRAQQACRQVLSELQSKIGSEQARLEGQQKRQSRLESEITELQQQLEQLQTSLGAARAKLGLALDNMANFSKHKETLQQKHHELKLSLQQANEAYQRTRDERHRLELKHQQITTQRQAVEAGIARIAEQAKDISTRRFALEERLTQFVTPTETLRLNLDNHLARRVSVELLVTDARQALEVIDAEMRSFEKGRLALEKAIADIREQWDKSRVEHGATQVRAQTVQEKLEALACDDPQAILSALPAEFEETDYETQLADIVQKIQRLGAINLAAIEEYQAELERRTYLDAQLQDLTEALNTLEEAIAKIDRETRAKFKETFDKVNGAFKTLFPRLFGGGEADLILTGEDLLNTGLTVMARPPGKKNSSIHLLSGGEKALTAVALVFAIFQLNPAPFCLLDEVDAPLDDANVARFCELVKYMSKTVQFIFITHNKLAMEMADQLAGVTMKEPGVSRLVAVDVKEAVALTVQ